MKNNLLASAGFVALVLVGIVAQAQTKDTVVINPKTIVMANLPMGKHQYLVYFKKGKDSSANNFALWQLDVKKAQHKGRAAIIVDQAWDDNTGLMHTVTSVNDAKDFRPLYQTSWWKTRGTTVTDFEAKTATFPDQLFLKNIDSSRNAAMQAFTKATNEYVLNWHLDLEVFSMLPYKDGRTFAINFYDAGFSAPKVQHYTVKGSGFLEGYEQQKIDCWLLYHESPNNKETFWVSKKTFEILKLEQQFGPMYRYKIKMKL